MIFTTGESVGDRPGHEYRKRHNSSRRAQSGGVCEQAHPRQDIQPASAGVLQRGRRPHVLARLHLPDGRLPQRLLRVLRQRLG